MNARALWGGRPMRGMNPLYPSSDGQPMAENSQQYRWIATIQGNLEYQFRDRPDVFVAADNLIYPVEGKPEISRAPDVYVAFGVPKEDRGSFIVHEEGGTFPQVVFEVRSPSNRPADITDKLAFYDRYGAVEYYDYDPIANRLAAYVRTAAGLTAVPDPAVFRSPLLGITFDFSGAEMVIYGPNGERFLTRDELAVQADTERRRADRAQAEADRLRALLRAAGLDPDAPPR